MIPLSLYIHVPWCIKKCPYCDFNSHPLNNSLPESEYIDALIEDLKQDLHLVQNRTISTIFFGGGTPSLISPKAIENLLNRISKHINFDANIEITLEANPGTIERHNLADFKLAGINRISLGAQSFNNHKLKLLGRIHKAEETFHAVEQIQKANFNSFNIDLMHGLPHQTVEEAILDLTTALSLNPPHLSWYQLTLEPNTVFYKYPPQLPDDDITWEIQTQGEKILNLAGFIHYEVSAFSKPGMQCKHNVNYWSFGDYLGIGAGAHGKTTNLVNNQIQRTWKTRNPKDYLDPNKKFLAGSKIIPISELPFEYMLNRLRLFSEFDLADYQLRTGLPIAPIADIITKASEEGLISHTGNKLEVTNLGKRFLNNLMQMFLNEMEEEVHLD